MKRVSVDRAVGLMLLAVAAVIVLAVELSMGQGWVAVGHALGILMVGLAAGWSAERLGRHRAHR